MMCELMLKSIWTQTYSHFVDSVSKSFTWAFYTMTFSITKNLENFTMAMNKMVSAKYKKPTCKQAFTKGYNFWLDIALTRQYNIELSQCNIWTFWPYENFDMKNTCHRIDMWELKFNKKNKSMWLYAPKHVIIWNTIPVGAGACVAFLFLLLKRENLFESCYLSTF